jgi:hypothetical protein
MTITLTITVADQPGEGGGGEVDPPPDGGEGTSTTDTAEWQGVTFTLSEECTVGYLADGKPFFVDPGHAVTVSWSPATTTAGGNTVNGAMKNPDRNLMNAWDQRALSGGYYSAGMLAAAPVSMRSNDSLAVEIHNPDPTTTNGGTASHPVYALAYSAIICLAAEPAAHSYIPALGPYANGGTARPVYVLDVAGLTFPEYEITSAVESMATVLGRMGRYNPVAAQVRPVEGRRQLTPAGFANGDGYGRNVAIAMAHAGVRLIGDDPVADKRTLARYMMMHFAEWYPAIEANGTKLGADGGQNEGLLLPMLLGLGWTEDAAIATLPADVGTNELTQAFEIDAGLLAKMREPHDTVANDQPISTLRRTITNVAGNVLTFTDAASWLDVFVGTLLVRESDGATARVTAYNPALKTMTIDAQPGTPFANTNVCFNRAPYAQAEGDAEWCLKGLTQFRYYTGAKGAAYRDLNEWDGQVLCAMAWGFVHSDWAYWVDYVARANAGVDPAAPDTYPDHFSSTGVRDFWNTHWAAISAVEQTVG